MKSSNKKPVQEVSTEGWTFRWNDTTLSQDEYNKLVRDHQDWLEEQERKATIAAQADKPKRTRKNS